jgi:membrane-bound lytic murein transglycosylase D
MKKTNILLTIGFILMLALMASCASTGSNGKGGMYSSRSSSIEQLIQETDLDEGTPAESASNGNVNGNGSGNLYSYTSKKSSVKQKIPRTINESVKKWIKYFTVDNPEWFQRALARSEEYETHMKNILINYEVPEELFYLALIESAFVQRAHSSAGAKGIWQFMKGTARLYGLQVTRKSDERLSPYRATAAAAAYLRDLYNIYGSWYLAIASYNAGEGRIRNAIIKHRERNFWELAAKNALPEETMNYVPKYIAAAIIAENPKLYGFNYNGPSKDAVMVAEDVSKMLASEQYRRGAVAVSSRSKLVMASASPTMTTTTTSNENTEMTIYRVKRGDNLSRIAAKNDVTLSQIRECNSRLKGDNVFVGQKLVLRCLKTGAEVAQVTQRETAVQEEAGETVMETTTAAAATTKAPSKRIVYRVHYGDTLEGISKKFGTTIAQLKECNPTVKRYEILAGQRLKVACSQDTELAVKKAGSVTHVVKRGESLWSISQKYDVSITDIMKWNNLKKRSKIFAGRKLKILSKKKEVSAA